jgi:hypothetical protein
MKYSEEIYAYLDDKKFSNGLEISFVENLKDESRINKIIHLCRDKKVIHLGCADHIELIEQKIEADKWLHKLLINNADVCIGIDINADAVDYINKRLSIKNVFCIDIEKEKPVFLKKEDEWDYLVLGEIIEHVENPVSFLKKINEVFSGYVKKIIITAPNVLNVTTIKDIKNNLENINTNHIYWFSPYTLTRVVHKSGFRNIEFSFVDRVALPFCGKVFHKIKAMVGITEKFESKQFSVIIMTADFRVQ